MCDYCNLLVTRAATEAELVELLVPRLRRMLRAGTTTVECKVELGQFSILILILL